MPVSRTPLLFDGGQAFQTVKEFVTTNPKRVTGSIEARQATGHIRDFLKRQGYQLGAPTYFNATIAGRRQAGSNIVAFKAGVLPEILGVVAHYDTTRTAVQGAMDDGSGVGVALELARIFAAAPLRHSLLILATDGEEWGMLGAADFAANYPERQRIAALLSLDFVSVGDLAGLQLGTDGQRGGYAPGWLRRIAFDAAKVQGLPVAMPSGLNEYTERAIALSPTDQGPFLHAGLPAINLGSRSVDKQLEQDAYHSENDTIDNLKPASLSIFGQTAERILRSIDELPAAPPGMDNTFRWHGDRYVAGWAMACLQYLAFLPCVIILGYEWRRYRESLVASAILREITFSVAWLVPFVLAFPMILFCRLMRFLPQNSLYPGPLKDPMLIPSWGVVAGISASAAAIGVGVYFLARFLTRGLPLSYGSSRVVQMTLLLVVVLLALGYGPYWASTFLTLPALVWGFVGEGRSGTARAWGALAIAAAGLFVPAVAFLFGDDLRIGADAIWYAVLGLSNGMLRWQGYLLVSAASVIGLRFLALQLVRR